MKVLMLGGTRFFGKHAVRALLKRGHTVTIGTRGRTPDAFGDGFRLSAGRPDNRFIGQKVRILHAKAPPFSFAEASKSCGFDTRSYSGSVRTFPRFPVVYNP